MHTDVAVQTSEVVPGSGLPHAQALKSADTVL